MVAVDSTGKLEMLREIGADQVIDYTERDFTDGTGNFDIVFVDTPTGVDWLRQWHPNVWLAPVGYDKESMGEPAWLAEKKYDLGIYGSALGERRNTIWPALKEYFGKRLLDLKDMWGISRNKKLNECRAILHISHSRSPAVSTLRLWQAASCSAALIKERDDSWPAVPGMHFAEIPRFEEVTKRAFFQSIEAVLLSTDLDGVARRMHKDLSKWTPERIMQDFYVPASLSVPR